MRSSPVAISLAAIVCVTSCTASDDPDDASAATAQAIASTTEPVSTATTAPPAPVAVAPTSAPAAPETSAPSPELVSGPQPPADAADPTAEEFTSFDWAVVNDEAPWTARAGLRGGEWGGRLLALGGRPPNQATLPGDSTIWADVWASDDGGATWVDLLAGEEAPWPARAYFQAVVHDDHVYVLGGQDFGLQPNPFCALLEQGLEPPPGLGIDPDAPCPEFLPTSNFFDDVWRSPDGVTWEQVTDDAPWQPRAGLSAEVVGDHIYVLAGSQNDDSSIVGSGGPARIYFNDVWRSTDGADWELMTDAAPWEPRAGGATVERDGLLFLFGGEDGFTCEPLPDCDPPYFNDVWVTSDGATWVEVTESAGWSPRPGHVCNLVGNQFLCFGGFGLLENPTDMWISADGATWQELPATPWGSDDPTAMRYDFDSIVIDDDGPIILTFGGDRETFDFADPDNYLRIENDVWAFSPPT
ncbi:MAG: hypothetical protein ACO3WU_02615 [Ilumatobacteraceae bacterium]